MRKACTKAETGKCPGGACPNHAVACRGKNNVRSRSTAPQYSMEDALIEMIDRKRLEERALLLPHAAA